MLWCCRPRTNDPGAARMVFFSICIQDRNAGHEGDEDTCVNYCLISQIESETISYSDCITRSIVTAIDLTTIIWNITWKLINTPSNTSLTWQDLAELMSSRILICYQSKLCWVQCYTKPLKTNLNTALNWMFVHQMSYTERLRPKHF